MSKRWLFGDFGTINSRIGIVRFCHSFGRCLVPNSHTWPAFGDAIWYSRVKLLYVQEWNHLCGLQEGNHPKVQSGHWDWTTVSQADLNLASSIYIYLHLSTTLPETSSSPLKISWKLMVGMRTKDPGWEPMKFVTLKLLPNHLPGPIGCQDT